MGAENRKSGLKWNHALFGVAAGFAANGAMVENAHAAPREIALTKLGTAPFAGGLAEARDQKHLDQVFAASVQEGTLTAADKAEFMAKAAGTLEDGTVAPEEKFEWMTYRGGSIAGKGSDMLVWKGTKEIGTKNFKVTRSKDGMVVTYAIAERTEDGKPCFNVFPVSIEPALTPVETLPPPALKIEAVRIPCAPIELVDDKRKISPNSRFKMTALMSRAEAESIGIDALSQCGELVLPKDCEQEACDLINLEAQKVAITRRQNPDDPRVIAAISREFVALVYQPQSMVNGKIKFSVPAQALRAFVCRLPESDSRGRLTTFGRIGIERSDIVDAFDGRAEQLPGSVIKPSSVQPLKNGASVGGQIGRYLQQTAPPSYAFRSGSYRSGVVGAEPMRPPVRMAPPVNMNTGRPQPVYTQELYGDPRMGMSQNSRGMSNLGGRMAGAVASALEAETYLGTREWARRQVFGGAARDREAYTRQMQMMQQRQAPPLMSGPNYMQPPVRMGQPPSFGGQPGTITETRIHIEGGSIMGGPGFDPYAYSGGGWSPYGNTGALRPRY